jgi:hypothetical protein
MRKTIMKSLKKSVSRPQNPARAGERGMALVAVMLIMSLMLMLGIAVTFSAVSDGAITANFKSLTSGFYAAEAGIGNLHRTLRSEEFVTASLPDPPTVVVGQPTLNEKDFIIAAEQLLDTYEKFPNDSAYRTKIKIKEFHPPYPANDTNPAHASRRISYKNVRDPRRGQIEPYSISYEVQSVGEGISGLNGLVTLVEEGVLNFKLLVNAEGGAPRVGSFSEFALYMDKFDPYNPEGPFIYQGLGPGDRFSGRVHTNQRFGFWTPADGSDAPTFRGYVTQAYRTASYYRHGAGVPPAPVDADSDIVAGVLVAPRFLAGFDRGVDPIPPPDNAFDQARAVIDGGSTLAGGPPTDGELHSELRAASDLGKELPSPKNPDSITPSLKNGVYIPTDGEALTGSGIYVMGHVDDMQLSADENGNRQIIKITQGGKTTTVTIDIDAGTTTIDSPGASRTLRGVPLDRSLERRDHRSAASIYVYGDINSLRGPGRTGNGGPGPAVDSNFAVTVTAGGHVTSNPRKPVEGGSITITGDLTYETPVVDTAGQAVNPDAKNVLGLFASGGNINIPIDGRAPDNMTVHGSIAAFDLLDAEGNPVLGPNGTPYGGRIRSEGLENFHRIPNRGRFTLVGGAQSSNYDNLGVYDGTFHGYQYKGVWDPRYDRDFSPPFYPGYIVDTGGPLGPPTVKAQTNFPTVLSYKRLYYGSAQAGH